MVMSGVSDLEIVLNWAGVLGSLCAAIYVYRYYFIKNQKEEEENHGDKS